MSGEERERVLLVRQVVNKRVRQREAAERLGIGVRQVKRLVRRWRQEGDPGLVSRHCGRASNRRMIADNGGEYLGQDYLRRLSDRESRSNTEKPGAPG